MKKKNKNINILSWNLCWEAMKGKKSKNLDMRKCIENNKNFCKSKLLDKLSKIILKKNISLIAFQEYNIVKSLFEVPFINNYHIVTGVSGKETAVSLFRRDLFSYIKHEYGDLCGNNLGRTYLLIVLRNKITKEKTIFLNVHFPHENRPIKNARKIAERKMRELISKYNKNRIIVAGDHNFEYNMKSYKKFINRKFYLDKLSKNTCCSSDIKRKPNLKYDIILDSKDKDIKYTFVGNAIHNSLYVSDHVPLIASIIY
jgi:hypothetical protein